MQKARLGRTGASVSRIGLGTWAHGGPKKVKGHPVGWSGHDDAQANQAVLAAFESGINHFDTADVYGDGNAEKLLGTIWRDVPRDQVFLASKVGWDPGGHKHYYHPELIQWNLERSLKLLETDFLDLYYLHHCDFGPEDCHLGPALETMRSAQAEGKFRYLGLSDWSSEKVLRALDAVNPDVIQIYRNVLDDEYTSSGLADKVRENDIGVVFFSPLKHGVLLGKYEQPPSFPEGDMRNRISEFHDSDRLRELINCRRAVETRLAEHPEPVLWALTGALLEDSVTGSVLVGMRNESQARAAGTLGASLTSDTAQWVRSVYRGEISL